MSKVTRDYRFRVGYECPVCKCLRKRRYDLVRHLVEKHDWEPEVAKAVVAALPDVHEEVTSVRHYEDRTSRYSQQGPGGK